MLPLAKIPAQAFIALFSRENFAQYSLRNEFSSSYVLTNFAQTLPQCRTIKGVKTCSEISLKVIFFDL